MQHNTHRNVWNGEPWDERFNVLHERPGQETRDAVYAHARHAIHSRQPHRLSPHVRGQAWWGGWLATAAALLLLCGYLSHRMSPAHHPASPAPAVVSQAAVDAAMIMEEHTQISLYSGEKDPFAKKLDALETSLAWLEQDVTYELTAAW